jgi:hypothetical protein
MSKGKLIAGFLLLLCVLHQDFWLRDDPRLVFGILPASLAYHVGWTLCTALGWFLVIRHAWPAYLEETPAPGAAALRRPEGKPTAR